MSSLAADLALGPGGGWGQSICGSEYMFMRHTLRRLLPATLVVAATASGAVAADLGPYDNGRQTWRAPRAAYYPPALRWSGFYAGVQAGYGWGTTDATSTALSSMGTEAFNYSTSGAIGGLHAGYNWQFNQFVLGLETDLESSGVKGSGIGTFSSGHSTSIDWMGSLRARAGFTTGNTLLYVTGGLAYGGVTVDRSAGAAFKPFAGDDAWKTGWTLGAGVEHAFTRNISARLEYRYTDLGTVTYTNLPANLNDTSSISNSAVRAGLSFKF